MNEVVGLAVGVPVELYGDVRGRFGEQSVGVSVGVSMGVSMGVAVGASVDFSVGTRSFAVGAAVKIAVEIVVEIAMARAIGLHGVPLPAAAFRGSPWKLRGSPWSVRGYPRNAVDIAVEYRGGSWTLSRCPPPQIQKCTCLESTAAAAAVLSFFAATLLAIACARFRFL